MSSDEPATVDEKVPLSLSTRSVEVMSLPELGRSGVLKYA